MVAVLGCALFWGPNDVVIGCWKDGFAAGYCYRKMTYMEYQRMEVIGGLSAFLRPTPLPHSECGGWCCRGWFWAGGCGLREESVLAFAG